MTDSAIQIRGVWKRFGHFEAVRGIDLDVRVGEVFGFLGPNGAGKTTTLRMVTGLLRPSAGTIHLGGVDLRRDPLRAKRQIGFIADRPYIYEKLTGSEFLRFVGGLWGMGRKDIADGSAKWLECFDLQGWQAEPIESYSHGMRQRLLLCCALLHRPSVLVLDEPMVGLDPRGAKRLKDVVRQLARDQGLTVVLSTHTLEVVEQICDTVGILHQGKIIVGGALDQVMRDHGQRLEQLFLDVTESTAFVEASKTPAAAGSS